MMASVRTENKTYDSFADKPFIDCADGESVEVIFSDTDDPYFYDVDRRAPKVSIEDEIEWDRQVAAGETTMSLTDWIHAQWAVPPPTADEWELPAFEFPALAAPPDFPALFKKA